MALLHTVLKRNSIKMSIIRTIKGPPQFPEKLELPNFPVPALDHTLNVFLKSTKPLVTPKQFCKTAELVTDFKNNDGLKLQELLTVKAKESQNWLKDYWLRAAYLEYRNPVVIYSSPGQVFPALQFDSEQDQLCYASKLVMAAVELSQIIRDDKLPQEKMGKDLIDMSQYKNVFGGTRIPKPKTDELIVNPDSRNILVLCNNHFYILPVLDDDRNLFNFIQTYDALKQIYCHAYDEKTPKSEKIGSFTGLNRDKWADIYETLTKNSKNNLKIHQIEETLFALCLDEVVQHPNRSLVGLGTLTGEYTIHGFGTSNRWYDKIIQIVVSRNGLSGVTYEHTPGEGQTVTLLTDYISDFVSKGREMQYKPAKGFNNFEHIQLELSNEIKKEIPGALENLQKLSKSIDFEFLSYKMYGREFIKRFKFSPDSFIQIAIQFAFIKCHEEPGAQYESGSLRKFIYGRTECIRSCTCEVVNFISEMLDPNCNDTTRYQALKSAIDSHKAYVNLAVNGKGCDRHLLGLRLIAAENGYCEHPLFSDIGYKKSSSYRLSTSQVPSQTYSFMCYAPLVGNGYGCCYNPRPDDILFGISSFAECKETNAANFSKNLAQALCDMQRLLYANASKL